jgi:hypothetical protein
MTDINAGTTNTIISTTSGSLADLASRIKAAHHAVGQAMAHAIEAGQLLIEAKKRIPHGNWLSWLEAFCDMSERTAQAYMRVARQLRQLDGADPQRAADLSIRTALKRLSKTVPHVDTRKEPKGRKQPAQKAKPKAKPAAQDDFVASFIKEKEEVDRAYMAGEIAEEQYQDWHNTPLDTPIEPAAKEQNADSDALNTDDVVAVPLDANPICKAWGDASEKQRAEFAELFGGDVARRIPNPPPAPPPLSAGSDYPEMPQFLRGGWP